MYMYMYMYMYTCTQLYSCRVQQLYINIIRISSSIALTLWRGAPARRNILERTSHMADDESGGAPSGRDDDEYNLDRYTRKQKDDHAAAVSQLRDGQKTGCWSWWILP